MVTTLSQDLDTFQQASQDAQSQAGVSATYQRRQAGQIASLERSVEELRKALEVADAEKQDLQLQMKSKLARQKENQSASSSSRDDSDLVCMCLCHTQCDMY